MAYFLDLGSKKQIEVIVYNFFTGICFFKGYFT